ncbi:penicillin-binding protein [Streptomyces sp. MBT67]|uniref:transglycosylase domain-containing protein n=1 Tax=unclassified Streptomyces TaxID=2593676 RepID=UPI001909DD5A|nr:MULTISPECIES: transglycosylase domain-containing protein [unclassified Streptomyces]MBK3529931.1 penicillin-binding protein [Streptomyces sp. MBT72]MBK3535269.1 penicillin-binding protein [Streptomyces sp. MBT67]MBK3552115.1 penicillin-binding protein [Streptomyces sp. MBT61]MBK6031360.1 penicillin-binding protein [Streptomyces sp. MBT59]
MSDEPQSWAPRDSSGAEASSTGNPPPTASGEQPGQTPGKPGKPGKKARPRRTGWRRAVPTWRMTLGTLLGLVVLLGAGIFAAYRLVDIPAANASATAQSNVYLYSDGSVIARDGDVNREKVKLSQVPPTVQHAVLAAEDRDFYTDDRAVDVKAMLRAGWNTVTGKGKQGGSTITQQYVKNYYLGQERTVLRKAKEAIIAVKLNREETKDQIFEGYLNTSYFGRNAYGIQAAAQAYYGKNVEELTTAEGAYLASLLNAPSAYDVIAHPGNKPAAQRRWNYVLNGMVKERWLTAAERATTRFPTPGEAKPSNGLSGQRGYIVQAVEDYLNRRGILDAKTLATGGYRITTTLDRAKQDAFVEAVADNVMSKTSADRAADRNVRVGGASIVPKTGKVVALYGGIDYTKQYVSNATRRDYQVGSVFKPFVLTSAVVNDSTTQDGRRITPNTVYDGTNKRTVVGVQGSTDYAPANEDDVDYGDITVRIATDKSVNSVYAQMAQDVGPAKVRDTAIALGIPADTPDLTAAPSIALGTANASVLDMAEAYATLADHGRHGRYALVEKVTKDGAEIELPERTTEQAVSREAADTTTAVLRSVVEGGTGTAAQAVGRPAVGKTGTAEEDRAAWFAGYTPDLASVVAVMGQNPDTGAQTPLYGALGLSRVNGGGAPAETWAAYTEAALRSSPAQEFDLRPAPGSDEGDELLIDENADGGTDPSSSPDPDATPDSTSDTTPDSTPDGSAPPTTGTSAGGNTGGNTSGDTTGGADEGAVSVPDGNS